MKILDVAQASDKIVLAQNEPGNGFESKIKQDAKKINVEIINVSALKNENYTTKFPKFPQSHDSSKFDEIVANSSIKPMLLLKPNENWPEVKAPTAWIVNDFEKLTKEKQVDFCKNLNDRLKESKDLKIIVPFNYIENISGEVLKNSTLLLNASLLPPIGSPISFSEFPKADLTEIRRKYNSGDAESKNTPK